MEKRKPQIWFTSDLHFGHKNIVKYTNRPAIMELDIENDSDWIDKHDEWLIKRWNDTVSKIDTVYILGDFSFASAERTEKILQRLNGKKHLILGNHDGVISADLKRYFESVTQIKDLVFKPQPLYPFLKENFTLVLCHYPMLTWNKRAHGSCMVHGHTHNSISQYNVESRELRVDVGIDSDIAQYGFVSLETLYEYFCAIKGDKTFNEHSEYMMTCLRG